VALPVIEVFLDAEGAAEAAEAGTRGRA